VSGVDKVKTAVSENDLLAHCPVDIEEWTKFIDGFYLIVHVKI